MTFNGPPKLYTGDALSTEDGDPEPTPENPVAETINEAAISRPEETVEEVVSDGERQDAL